MLDSPHDPEPHHNGGSSPGLGTDLPVLSVLSLYL